MSGLLPPATSNKTHFIKERGEDVLRGLFDSSSFLNGSSVT